MSLILGALSEPKTLKPLISSALKVAEVDLATARSHVQQFQDISQANEAALANLNATHDEYKTATEAELERRQVCLHSSLGWGTLTKYFDQSEIQALQEKLRLAEERLNEVTQQNAEIQRTFDSERAAWVSDKKELEATILDMTTSAQHTQTDKSTWEAEIRHQEQRAKVCAPDFIPQPSLISGKGCGGPLLEGGGRPR